MFHFSLIRYFLKSFLPVLIDFGFSEEHSASKNFSFQTLQMIRQISLQNSFLAKQLEKNQQFQTIIQTHLENRVTQLVHSYGANEYDPVFNSQLYPKPVQFFIDSSSNEI